MPVQLSLAGRGLSGTGACTTSITTNLEQPGDLLLGEAGIDAQASEVLVGEFAQVDLLLALLQTQLPLLVPLEVLAVIRVFAWSK